MARLFLNRLNLVRSQAIDDDTRKIVLCAALLHDLGHGPFSHAFEKVTKDSHESRTREIVEDEETDVHRALAANDPKLPRAIADFWRGGSVSAVPGFLTHVISSQLDADRFDYLLRDSYAAGVDYGEFDHLWLISHLHVDEEHSRLYLSSKALLATEAYIFARYHMYRTVYFHKTTRAAEVMLRLLFQRYKALVEGKTLEEASEMVPGSPTEVIKAFSSSQLSLHDYLGLDDHSISQFCKACEMCKDAVLQNLGSGLLHRRYLKAIDATGRGPAAVSKFTIEATKLLENKGYDISFLADDIPSDTPYKMYDPDSEAPMNTQIYIENQDGKQVEISTLSEPVHELRKKYALARFYVPADVRDDIASIANKTLRS